MLVCFAGTSSAQVIPPHTMEDVVYGWMKVYHLKGTKTGTSVDHRKYSGAQLSICDSFVNWMQASYIPKGGLGNAARWLSEKMSPYNQFTIGLPPNYGAVARTYVELKKNEKGKIEPYTSNSISWKVSANEVPGWPVRHICSASQYYFTLPNAETEVDDEVTRKRLDLTKHPNTAPYVSFWLKNEGFGSGTQNVLLCKDNKSPFIKITKGEYLDQLELAIPAFYKTESKKIFEAQQGIKSRVDYEMKNLDARIAKYREGLKANRDKYKSRLGELAVMGSSQPRLIDLDNGRDVFTGQYLTDPDSEGQQYQIYKLDTAMVKLCTTDKPQWVMVFWDYYNGASAIEKQQHDAIMNNFNFEYVYNFFFAPEKVKGKGYQPLQSPLHVQSVVASPASSASKTNLADKNVFFFDDFSTTATGKKPVGWKTRLSGDGTTSVVGTIEDADGTWAVLKGHYISAELKKSLPQDFTVTYDLVASKGFTWGAKGLTMQLAYDPKGTGNPESFLKLRMRPGYDGRDGEATLETKFPFPPGYSNETRWLTATGFSNDKKMNLVKVTIKKKNEMLQVFIDDKKIAEYQKAIPLAHVFNALSFDCGGNSSENDKYYISNIKITRE